MTVNVCLLSHLNLRHTLPLFLFSPCLSFFLSLSSLLFSLPLFLTQSSTNQLPVMEAWELTSYTLTSSFFFFSLSFFLYFLINWKRNRKRGREKKTSCENNKWQERKPDTIPIGIDSCLNGLKEKERKKEERKMRKKEKWKKERKKRKEEVNCPLLAIRFDFLLSPFFSLFSHTHLSFSSFFSFSLFPFTFIFFFYFSLHLFHKLSYFFSLYLLTLFDDKKMRHLHREGRR